MRDLLLHTTGELLTADGDFATGESTLQHQELLLVAAKGEWKESPAVGVGIAGYLLDEDVYGLLAEVKTQFEKDGMAVQRIAMDGDKLFTDADY